MIIDPQTQSPNQRYHTLLQTIIPRPIAWILSDNGQNLPLENRYNLAPFSFFNAVCSDPPLVMVSIGHKPDGSLKDTAANILERQHFVVHIASRHLAETLSNTSATLPHGSSELTREGLAVCELEGFPLPRLACCPVAMGCRLYQCIELGPGPQYMILGEVQRLFIDDAIVESQGRHLKVHADRLDALARLGSDEYLAGGQILHYQRPD